MPLDESGMRMNERVRHLNGAIHENQRNSILPLRLLEMPRMMEKSLPDGCSSDGIRIDLPGGAD